MEFGPRALGSRSILGDARSRKMQSVMNLKIKFRESFRPFAPAVLREHVHEYFDMQPGEDSPYMLLVAPVHETQLLAADGQAARGASTSSSRSALEYSGDHARRLLRARADGRCRAQPALPLRSFERFKEKTGCPVMINTSFNVRGEPIVCTPARRLPLLHGDGHGRPRARALRAAEERAARTRAATERRYLAEFALD